MKEINLQLEYGRTPHVLLLGNGINRAFSFGSWDDLLKSIGTKALTPEECESLGRIPYPLRPVVLTDDHVGSKMKEIAPELAALRAGHEEEELLRAFAGLPVDAILTTNYTYELEKAMIPGFRCAVGRRCLSRRVCVSSGSEGGIRRLHTCFIPPDGKPALWHIHGEAARADTMILGHYDYGKLLSGIQQYIPRLMARLGATKARGLPMAVRSWVDYFLLGNVHMVGFGLDLSEMDLWWLLGCKKRNFPHTKVYLHKPNISAEQRLLAEAYGVTVVKDSFPHGGYGAYYRLVLERLRATLPANLP